MATKEFAKLGLNGKVIEIIVVDDTNCQDTEGNYSEQIGINFCTQLTNWAIWKGIENTNGQPSIDGYYIEDGNYFKTLQPYSSWTYNTTTYKWEAPTPHPDMDNESSYRWDESTTSWVSKT